MVTQNRETLWAILNTALAQQLYSMQAAPRGFKILTCMLFPRPMFQSLLGRAAGGLSTLDAHHCEVTTLKRLIVLGAVHRIIPESLRWLLSKGKYERAHSVVKRIIWSNNLNLASILRPCIIKKHHGKGSIMLFQPLNQN